MTVAATLRKAGPYAGNGVTTSFPFSFKVFDAEGIQPVLTDSSGAATELLLGSDYSVLLNTDQDANPGGTVTYPILVGPSPLPVGATLTIIGGMSYDQSTDITNNGRFLPQVFENAYDKLTILIQQLKEISDRTLQAAVGTTVKLLFPAPSSGKFIRWRSDLLGLENADAGTDSMALQGLLADAASDTHGSYLVGYKPGPSAGVPRTVQSKLRETLSVKDFGAIGNGVANDTAAIQAAFSYAGLIGGMSVFFPAGTYLVRSAITVPTNTRAFGAGRYVSRVKVDAANWTSMAPGKGSGNRIFTNTNFEAATLTDSDIIIETMAFDWDSMIGGDEHAVSFRMASRVSIKQCDFFNGGNATALLACQDTVTDDCYASGQRNAGFDHWDGAVGAKVTNCVVRAPNAVQGIQVTGSSTSGSPVRASSDVVIMGNSVYGCTGLYASGIIVNSVASGSSVSVAHINSNHVSGASIGVAVTGGCGAVLVSNNTIDGSDEAGVFVGTDTSGQYPTACILDGNLLTNCSASPANIGVIAITGGSDHLLQGNKVYLGTGTYAYACTLSAGVTGSRVINNTFQIGSGGVVNNPAGAIVEDYDEGTFTPALTFGGGATGLGYSARAGRYTKKGRLVFYELSIQLSAKGSSTGNASIGGLPYAAGVTPAARPTGSVMFQNMNSIGYTIIGNVSGAGIALQNGSTTTELAQLTEANFNNNTNLFISGFYST